MALNWDDFGSFWSCNWDVEKPHFSGSGKSESKGLSEAVNDDIVDRLPADPFGMEISFAAAITGWFEGFENDFESDLFVLGKQDGDEKKAADQQHMFKGLNWVFNGTMSLQHEEGNSSFYGFGSEDVDKRSGDQSSFFEGMNLVCNGTLSFQQEEGSFGSSQISIPNDDFNGFGIGNGLSDGDFVFNYEGGGLEDICKGVFCDNSEGGAAPNDALFFTLGYLGVKELLAVEKVCRSMRDAVRSDLLLWRSIHIEHSLSKRITDDALLKLTSRAQGTLECLSLAGCVKITDDGLRRVLETNPRLTKLCVPECTRLSVEGILSNLRFFKSIGSSGMKHLRIGGSFSVTEEQFKELKFLLNADNLLQLGAQKPQFFREGHLHLMSDDDRALDIDVCPRCQNLKLIYDCPLESCRRTHNIAQLCRACILCIARCFHCGCCFKDIDYLETFTLDFLCFNCWKQKGASSSKHTLFHQETGMSRRC